MIEYLLQCDPSSTKKLTHRNETPLHLACKNETQGANQVFDALLEVDADPVRMKSWWGCIPLHIACQGYLVEPAHIVDSLLAAYPESAALMKDHGELAIHIAAQHSTTADHADRRRRLIEPEHVVASLLAAYPKGAALASGKGQFAIHVAARYSSTPVLDMIFNANKAALTNTVTDTERWFNSAGNSGSVMHYALMGKNFANIEYLHTLDPSLMAIRNEIGNTPLHEAVGCWSYSTNDINYTVFHLDFSRDPSVLSVADNDGRLVLHHIASSSKLSDPLSNAVKCLRLMLKAYPQGASHLDNDGETPYSICQDLEDSSYARRLFLMALPSLDPDLLRQVNYEARRQVLFLAFAAVQKGGAQTLIRRLRLHRDATINVVRHISSFL